MFHYVLFNEGPSLIFASLSFMATLLAGQAGGEMRERGSLAAVWSATASSRRPGSSCPLLHPWACPASAVPPTQAGRAALASVLLSAPVVCTLGVNTEPRHPGRSAVGGGSVGRVREEVLSDPFLCS